MVIESRLPSVFDEAELEESRGLQGPRFCNRDWRKERLTRVAERPR